MENVRVREFKCILRWTFTSATGALPVRMFPFGCSREVRDTPCTSISSALTVYLTYNLLPDIAIELASSGTKCPVKTSLQSYGNFPFGFGRALIDQ